MAIRYYHAKCGGEMESSIWKRKCKKCGKKFNIVSFLLTPKDIRPEWVADPPKRTSYAKWGDKVGAGGIAGRLPDWPRWARILSTGIVLGLIAMVFWLIFR